VPFLETGITALAVRSTESQRVQLPSAKWLLRQWARRELVGDSLSEMDLAVALGLLLHVAWRGVASRLRGRESSLFDPSAAPGCRATRTPLQLDVWALIALPPCERRAGARRRANSQTARTRRYGCGST
jgi:hypothetical protein